MKAMHAARLAGALALLLLALASARAQAPATAPAPQERKKATSDDRADPNASLVEVGKGTHMARQPLKPGAYFNDKARAAVRAYYASRPPKGPTTGDGWKIGEPLPAGSAPVPRGLLAKLPKLPPGHRYLQLHGDVLLVAAGSGMVVDAIEVKAK
ncbi:MAG: hypothetical protein JWP22_743 [Ramlibacter sp.]|nr:hypothetical protein [Ramlibacter sp.]